MILNLFITHSRNLVIGRERSLRYFYELDEQMSEIIENHTVIMDEDFFTYAHREPLEGVDNIIISKYDVDFPSSVLGDYVDLHLDKGFTFEHIDDYGVRTRAGACSNFDDLLAELTSTDKQIFIIGGQKLIDYVLQMYSKSVDNIYTLETRNIVEIEKGMITQYFTLPKYKKYLSTFKRVELEDFPNYLLTKYQKTTL